MGGYPKVQRRGNLPCYLHPPILAATEEDQGEAISSALMTTRGRAPWHESAMEPRVSCMLVSQVLWHSAAPQISLLNTGTTTGLSLDTQRDPELTFTMFPPPNLLLPQVRLLSLVHFFLC